MKYVTFEDRKSGLTFSIGVAGYEFPQSEDKFDANWLMVETTVSIGDQRFCDLSPSLSTGDLVRLATWFDQLALRRLPEWTLLSFTEPNLQFGVGRSTDAHVGINISLSHESRPKFEVQPGRDQATCFFKMSYAALLDRAAAFREMSEMFPQRHFTDKPRKPIEAGNLRWTGHALGQVKRRFGKNRPKMLH